MTLGAKEGAKMDKNKALKVGFIIVAIGLAITLYMWLSSAIFMTYHKLPVNLARPFTIFDYWHVYGHLKQYKVSFFIAWGLPLIVIVAMVFFVLADKNKRSLHGDARFAKAPEVRKSGLLNAGSQSILVGKFENKYLSYSGFQFVMLAAPTRSGKGVGVVIPNCLNYSDSLVVLDIKLENFDISSGFRAKHGQDVYLFSPFDENGRTHRYNPLGYISDDPNQRIDDIFSIAYGFYPDPEVGDKFWAGNARNLFIGLTLYLCETPSLPRTIGELLRQASGKGQGLKDYLTDIINERADSDTPLTSQCVDALSRFIGNSDNTLAGILSSLNEPLLIWANPRVDAATAANDFDLREVRKRRMTIYIGIQPNKLSDARVLVNLLFDQLYNLNTKELPQQNPDLKYQCLSLLDEFTSLGKVNIIANSVSYMAGYNMRLLTIIQNKSQLNKVYTEAGATTLMANHALMVMYAPSPVVQSDAVEYSEMLGYQTVKGISKSKQLSGKTSESKSESDQRRALMLPQEIRELGKDNEIVLLENTKPILCKKIKYYEDPNFQSRMNLPTPEIPLLDMDLHIAITENRQRAINIEDVKSGVSAEQIVGVNELPNLLSDSDEDIAAFVDDYFDKVVKFGVSEEEAQSMVDDLFSNVVAEFDLTEDTIVNDEGINDDNHTNTIAASLNDSNDTSTSAVPTTTKPTPIIDLSSFYDDD